MAQLAAREAKNPQILGSIPVFDHFLPKKSVARERSCERLVFILSMHAISGTCVIFRPGGGGSGMLFNRVNSLNRATSLTRCLTFYGLYFESSIVIFERF